VLDKPSLGIRVHRAVQERGDQLDELVAVHAQRPSPAVEVAR
jgi:hypothetical protein